MPERLSGMDSAFLSIETPGNHMHVVGVLLLDPQGMEGGYSFGTVRQMLLDRLHLMPPFRKRLVEAPLGVDHPVWIDDPDFDIDAHVHLLEVPAPGDHRALEAVVGDLAGRQLDRARPLWELHVIEGLADGNVAVVAKMHHATIDGASGADLMMHLFDLTPEVRAVEPPDEPFEGERRPSRFALVGKGLVTQALNPLRMARQAVGLAGNVVDAAKHIVTQRQETVLPFTAPRTAWTGAISPARSVAFGRVGLEDLKAIKDAHGGKVNDAVLAMTTYALREYLIETDDLPKRPLVASVPVAVKKDTDEPVETNQLTTLLAPLPVHLETAGEQLEAIIAATRASKDLISALGQETFLEFAQFMPPGILSLGSRIYTALPIHRLHPPMHNLIVSNVAGPPLPLYCGGARVEAIYPMGPLLQGAGMNLTVLSNMGNVDIGLIADRETVPEPWRIVERFPDAVAALLETI